MDIQEWLDLNQDKLDTDYERLFVTEVLSRIAEIDLAAVQAQYPFKDRLGRQRRCDFVLIEGEAIKIAIEVDGFDKRGRGGMNMGEFIDWLWRQNGLAHEGWIVLRFANVDVRDRPSRCAEHLRLLLREQRSKAGVVEDLRSQSDNLRKKIAQLDKTAKAGIRRSTVIAEKYETRAKETEAARKVDQARIAELEQQLEVLERQTKVAAHAKKLDSGEKQRLEALNEEQSISARDVLAMKFAIGAFTILLVCAMVLIAYLVVNQPPEFAATTPSTVSSDSRPDLVPLGDSCDNPIDWRDARRFLGRTVAVSGPVAAVTYREQVRGQPTWIDIGNAFPAENRVVLVIWGRNRTTMSGVINGARIGQTLCVRGTVADYRGGLQIELQTANQVQFR